MTLPKRKQTPKPLGPFGRRVKQHLEKCDLGRTRSIHVAEAFGMSDTTLRRRLRAEGIGYREILDAERMARLELFMRRRGRLAYGASIYQDLGYVELNSLYRAFRRWYDTSYERARQLIEVAA